jgi:hypothetical protein
MDPIERMFAERFAHWGITLPVENLGHRSAAHIQQNGWLIQFCFGHDESGDFMDYYASHRMTDDDHVRLYADGTVVQLAALGSAYLSSEDSVEAARLEKEYLESNRKISEELVAKGFNLFTLNMELRVRSRL